MATSLIPLQPGEAPAATLLSQPLLDSLQAAESSMQPGDLAWTTDDTRTIRRREAEKDAGQEDLKGEGMGFPPHGALSMSVIC